MLELVNKCVRILNLSEFCASLQLQMYQNEVGLSEWKGGGMCQNGFILEICQIFEFVKSFLLCWNCKCVRMRGDVSEWKGEVNVSEWIHITMALPNFSYIKMCQSWKGPNKSRKLLNLSFIL